MFNNVLVWIRADWAHALVALGAVLFAFATAWGAIKAAYLKTTGHPMPRNGLTLTLDVVAELAANALGAINKVLVFRGSPSLWSSLPADSGAPLVGRPTAPPPPPSGQSGSVTFGPLLVLCVVTVIVYGALLMGCPSVIREPAIPPPPDGCDAGATTCHNGAPWRCGPGGHWSQADRRCDGLGTDAAAVVCCTTPSTLRPDVLLSACTTPNLCAQVSP